MIEFNSPKADKDEVKALGAKYNGDKKVWYVPDGVDFHLFQKWIPEEKFKRLDDAPGIKSLEFKDLFKDISQTVNPYPKEYKVQGDIHDFYSANNCYIYTMIDNQNLRQTIRIVTPIGDCSPDKFVDKRVEVIGKLNIFEPYAQFQLKTEETHIRVLGECSRIQMMNDWERELKGIRGKFMKPEYKKFNNIGVIGQADSKGLTDFKGHLKTVAYENVNYKYKTVSPSDPLNTYNIINFLNEFNKETEARCDYICIVRGGGDPETLLQYSNPEFVRRIADFDIPIITGIGHDTDVLLCESVAAFNGKTPTRAAEKLNEIAGTLTKCKREQDNNRTVKKTIADYQKEVENLIEVCAAKDQKIHDLQEINIQLTQQFERHKNKGFFARLFRL